MERYENLLLEVDAHARKENVVHVRALVLDRDRDVQELYWDVNLMHNGRRRSEYVPAQAQPRRERQGARHRSWSSPGA